MAGCGFPVFYLLVCILWCAWLERKADAQQGGCRAMKFLSPNTGHYLKNHVIKTFLTGTRFRECEHQCLMTDECVSVNIQIGPTIDDSVTCELSNSDHIQHPDDLIARPGWTYLATENFCSMLKPCLNNAKCLYGYTHKKYLCVCAPGFTGENCKNDVDECSSGLHNCSKNASCINTVGNFSCVCNPGFTGDGDMCSDCNSTLRRFEEFQDLPTNYPTAVEQFIIDESLFLAFSNYGSDNGSYIYKLNNLKGKFALHQTMLNKPTRDFDYFTIADKHYLGVTLHFDAKVAIYQWNGTQFVNFQNVSFGSPTKLHFFTILPERFLAVTSYNSLTSIYKWKDKRFENFQDIASFDRAYGVTMFVINNETFIAIANHWSRKHEYALPSSVYKWSANSFVKTQSLQTYGAFDVKSFSISGDTFLAFANQYNGISSSIDSFIYKWNGTMFTLFQSIPTRRAQYFRAFVMCGETYLGVANYGDKSIVYRFSGSQFTKYREIATHRANGLTSFEYKGQPYLVVANRDGNSTVYKWV